MSGAASANFRYAGDGTRIVSIQGGVTTLHVGTHYDWTSTGTIKKYYYAGAQRLAMRENSTLYYLVGDHLGSTSVVANASGGFYSELRYTAWGETRYSSGTMPTDFRFTGQRQTQGAGLEWLYYYNARWYDPTVGRFLQADTIVPEPGKGQAYNRYAYVNNNPIKYVDPSGHCWGVASGIRGLLSYGTTCANLDMAFTIISHPSEVLAQENGAQAYALAVAYTTGEVVAHGTALVYGGATACGYASAACYKALTSGSGILGLLCQDGDCSNEVNAAAKGLETLDPALEKAKTLIDTATKTATRDVLRSGVEGLTSEQTTRGLEIVKKFGGSSTFNLQLQSNGVAEMVVRVPGNDPGAFARWVYTFDPSGKLLSIMQYGYNAAGEITHIHDKLNNIVVK